MLHTQLPSGGRGQGMGGVFFLLLHTETVTTNTSNPNITDDQIGILTFIMNLSMLRKLIDGLRCIDNFTSRCLDAQHREFFHMLYAGTKQVIVDLCEDEDYQRG
jgi:hypothetical protein